MHLFARLWGATSDARRAQSNGEKLDAIRDDIRRLYLIITLGDRKIMSTMDVLMTGLAAVQTDENAEDQELAQLEGLGASINTAIQTLEAQANPNLAPAIAMVTALKAQNDARLAKMQADVAAGTTLEGTLPQPATSAAAAPAEPVSDAVAKPSA